MGVKLRVKSYASNRAYCFFVVMLEQARRDTLVTIRTTRRACRDGDATSGIWAYKTDLRTHFVFSLLYIPGVYAKSSRY